MKTTVEQGQIQSPDFWINNAFNLAALWQELKDELTKAEMQYKSEIVALIEEGKKISQATLIVESKSPAYKMYCYLKGRDATIADMIRLARDRSKINTFSM